MGDSLTEGPLAQVFDAYTSEPTPLVIRVTFGINLGVGSSISTTLRSVVILLSGLLVALPALI